MNRANIIDITKQTICNDRQDKHGNPEDSHAAIADLWSMYLSHKFGVDLDLHGDDAAVMMVLLKIGRAAIGKPNLDTFVDMAGYAAIAGEIATGRDERHLKVAGVQTPWQ